MKKQKRSFCLLGLLLFICVAAMIPGRQSGAAALHAPTVTVTAISSEAFAGEYYPYAYILEGNITKTMLFTGSVSEEVYATIIPMDVKSAGLLHIEIFGDRMGDSPNEILYTDEALTNVIPKSQDGYSVETPGTYYYVIWSRESRSDFVDGVLKDLMLNAYILGNSYSELTEGDVHMMQPGDGSYRYYRFEMTKAANIRIIREEDKKFYSFSLCDASKKVLSTYNSKDPDTDHIYYLEPGTYYIKTKGESDAFGLGYKIMKDNDEFYLLSSHTFTFCTERSATVRVKISTRHSSVGAALRVLAEENCSLSVTLYDSKLRKISKTLKTETIGFYNYNNAEFGLEPNSTYYLMVQTNKDSGCSYPVFYATLKDAKANHGGKTKATAQSIPVHFSKSGAIGAGNGKADWYKLTANKKTKIRFFAETYSSKGMRITITNAKGTVIKKFAVDRAHQLKEADNDYWYMRQVYCTLPVKGTYYIKIQSIDGNGGTYHIENFN